MTPSLKLTAASAVIAVLAGVSTPADAETPPAHAAAIEAVLKCRDIGEAAARLACYDAAAGRMSEAEKTGEIIVLDRAQASAAHREAFGLPVPSLDFLSRAMKPDEANQVEGVVRALKADASGRWTLSLEGGAVWRQIDGVLFRPPHVGSKVRIRHGAIGSFLMNIDGQPAVKVHRDQ